MLNNILYRLSDGWDVVTLGQVSPTLRTLSEDRRLWKKLCQYHFAEKQVSGGPTRPPPVQAAASESSPVRKVACGFSGTASAVHCSSLKRTAT